MAPTPLPLIPRATPILRAMRRRACRQRPAAYETTVSGGGPNAFAAKFDTTKTGAASLVYSTYIGGGNTQSQSNGIALDAAGDVYLVGQTQNGLPTTANAVQPVYGGGPHDAFVSELNASGSGLIYSTYLGGTQDDVGTAIALGPSNNVYVTGSTQSTGFPEITSGAYDATENGNYDALLVMLNQSVNQAPVLNGANTCADL